MNIAIWGLVSNCSGLKKHIGTNLVTFAFKGQIGALDRGVLCQSPGHTNSFYQTRSIGNSLAGNVKSRAVVGAGTHQR